jgi:hypothetical protein
VNEATSSTVRGPNYEVAFQIIDENVTALSSAELSFPNFVFNENRSYTSVSKVDPDTLPGPYYTNFKSKRTLA